MHIVKYELYGNPEAERYRDEQCDGCSFLEVRHNIVT